MSSNDDNVQVGRQVEIMDLEHRRLMELVREMDTAVKWGRPGWFRSFLVAHNDAHRLVQQILTRSHAS